MNEKQKHDLKPVMFYANQKQHDLLKKESKKTGITISGIIKNLINDYFKKEGVF